MGAADFTDGNNSSLSPANCRKAPVCCCAPDPIKSSAASPKFLPKTALPLDISDDYKMNFDGFDLSSRTPWARLWTANELVNLTTEQEWETVQKAKKDVQEMNNKLEKDETLFLQQVKDSDKEVRLKKIELWN